MYPAMQVIGPWRSSWASAVAALASLVVLRAGKPITEEVTREGRGENFQFQDPNSRYACRGNLLEHAACQCKENEGELACVNAQFVDTEVFINLNNHYKYE